MTINMDDLKTQQGAEAWAARQGLNLTKNDRNTIAKLQGAELERLRDLNVNDDEGDKDTWLGRFNKRYPDMLDGLLNLGDIAVSGAFTLLISFGAPLLLMLLLAVEVWRVQHGIRMFDAAPAVSLGVAVSIVGLNMMLEAVIHRTEHKHGYQRPAAVEFSFASLGGRLRYIFGGRRWQPREKSPALREKRLLGLVSTGILLLATLGSMRGIIEDTEGVWYVALGGIFSRSDLAAMMTWLAGLVTALIAVFGAQGLMRYLSDRVTGAVAAMREETVSDAEDYAEELDAVAVNYIIARVAKQTGGQGAQPGFLPEIPAVSNGKGS